MSKFFKIFLVILTISACSKKDQLEELTITDDEGNVIVYSVETAQTKEEMTKGLMYRDTLEENTGMIFDFTNVVGKTVMWMKDTRIPLDMIFIEKDGTIFWIYENAVPESTTLIVAPYPAHAVLEVNGGDVEKFGIKIGSKVKHRFIAESSDVIPADVEVMDAKEEVHEDIEAIEDEHDFPDVEDPLETEDTGDDEETIILD